MKLRKEAALGGALGTGPVTTRAGSLLWVKGPQGPPDQEGPTRSSFQHFWNSFPSSTSVVQNHLYWYFRTWLSPPTYFYLNKCVSKRNFKPLLQLESLPHM